MSNQRKGFTLVEMLIVIFIIGLLSSIILVGLGSFRARGRDARRIADLHNIQNALELYFAKEGRYPDMTASSKAGWENFSSLLINAGIGIRVVPRDPATAAGRYYRYGISSDGLSYTLGSALEDANNPVLQEDVDGTLFGVECDDADGNYCIQF